jgi:hypothetical protein
MAGTVTTGAVAPAARARLYVQITVWYVTPEEVLVPRAHVQSVPVGVAVTETYRGKVSVTVTPVAVPEPVFWTV